VEKLLTEISAEKDPARQRLLRQGLAEVASPMKKLHSSTTFDSNQSTTTPIYALVTTLAAVGAAAFYYKYEADRQVNHSFS